MASEGSERLCPRLRGKADRDHGMPFMPLPFCTPSPRNKFSSRERDLPLLSLKLEVFSVGFFWWGNKMYLSFQTRGLGRAEGLCTVHISQSNPNSLNHEISFIQT